MRNAGSALFSALMGLVLGVPGAVLALWVWLAVNDAETARAWVIWAAVRSGAPLTVTPEQLAHDVVEEGALLLAGGMAAVMCLIALVQLRSAFRSLTGAADRAADRLALQTAPRVGEPLEGRVRLGKPASPGQMFRVDLRCTRAYYLDDRTKAHRIDTAFHEQQDVAVVHDGESWSVPFRFDIPATAPPTSTDGDSEDPPWTWGLEVYRAKAWFAMPQTLALTIGAQASEGGRALETVDSLAQKERIATRRRHAKIFRWILLAILAFGGLRFLVDVWLGR